MFVPGAGQRLHVPSSLLPFALTLLAVSSGVVAWAAVSTRTATREQFDAVAGVPPASIRSVAYAVAEQGSDVVYVRAADLGARPVAIAAFSYPWQSSNLRARGAASPDGRQLSVIHIAESLEGARLSLVDVERGLVREVEALVDYLSPMAWSVDGGKLAVVRTERTESGSEAVVSEVFAGTVVVAEAARFANVLQAVPVGYSLDGQRLFIVVVDRSGSSLWVRTPERVERLWQLSPGPTRDWSLSADGARLAFVDRLGAGGRAYAGRTLLIATGTTTDAGPGGEQVGAVWRPGVGIADFGGRDGTLQLSEPLNQEEYLLPLRWSPDGTMLVAAVYSGGGATTEDEQPSIQVISASTRTRLAEEPGARFFGWVKDLE